MTVTRAEAIPDELSLGNDPELAEAVLTIFRAASIEECIRTYGAAEARERAAFDDAMSLLTSELPLTRKRRPRTQAYTIRRQILSLGRSYWTVDPNGVRLFRIAGKLRFARMVSVRDPHGTMLCAARARSCW